ncbi:unnamed protein product [Mytilus coruscus]|uniref:Mab-21-like HhH/H2TH-like domain-containing protein n=1 Tax=Mytilus coruscus TaxID=42192 RepID=A0A6J8A8I2_MYTCO|nr:unnamed protein product [Mytilus coruscus]
MNGNATNQAKHDNGNSLRMRKITFWELYGVKRFPYRGRRKYTPLLYQSLDGGMIISNDVFGLTIRQFERMYKACLERRKRQEQWILNLRYPDKSSKEYLEYLENCTDCYKDHLVWLRNHPRQKYLFEHLVNIIGSEIDIRKRQRLFIIEDMISNADVSDLSKIFSGSLSEGLDLQGSDIDVMYILGKFDVIQNSDVSNVIYLVHRDTFVMETDIDHPGFTRLRLIAQADRGSFIRIQCLKCPPGTCNGESFYLDVNSFIDCFMVELNMTNYKNTEIFLHGPCLSNQEQTLDIAFCLRRKINQSNNKILLVVLESIRFGGIDGLITSLFKPDNENSRLLSTNSESSSIMLDFLFYRIIEEVYMQSLVSDISRWYKRLALTTSLLKSESSTFIIGVCKHHHAEISKYVAQLLPPPNTIGNKYNIRKCYHRHLQNGIKTDAVSGWLIYASFYYVTGQYKVTLRLLDYVMSRCSPDMIIRCNKPSCGHRIVYRQKEHSSMTLNDRMKMAIISNVMYCKYSSLIPEELKLEVETRKLDIPPVVMSNCLRFLCYHHLNDIVNRQKSLRDLHFTVKHKYFISSSCVSDSITILGVCYEISGAKDTAYQCYEEAMQVDYGVSSTAQIRKSKLDSSYC